MAREVFAGKHDFEELTGEKIAKRWPEGVPEYSNPGCEKEFKQYLGLSRLKLVQGTSAYPGMARGAVVFRGSSIPHTSYVVVVSTTNVNDTALVRGSAAVIANEGGLLCHAAVICRELKKPCIIGTKTATRVFKEYDYVEVDAVRGVARKLVKGRTKARY